MGRASLCTIGMRDRNQETGEPMNQLMNQPVNQPVNQPAQLSDLQLPDRQFPDRPLPDLQRLVPRDKHDDSHMEQLLQLATPEIEPILPAILEWIQDCNWPIAAKVLPLLARHETAVVPLVQSLLAPEHTDDGWKYWIVSALLPKFSGTAIQQLRPTLERIIMAPTPGESLEEVDQVAVELLTDQH